MARAVLLEPRSLGDQQISSGGRLKSLGFHMQTQKMSHWCWAAVSSSVGSFFGTGHWTQGEVANRLLQRTDCCTDPENCNSDQLLNQALKLTGSWDVWTRGKTTLPAIEGKIDSERPVCLRIQWFGGGAHYVAITGYDSQASELLVSDSLYQTSVRPYAAFPGNYHEGGNWSGTYWTDKESGGPQ